LNGRSKKSRRDSRHREEKYYDETYLEKG